MSIEQGIPKIFSLSLSIPAENHNIFGIHCSRQTADNYKITKALRKP